MNNQLNKTNQKILETQSRLTDIYRCINDFCKNPSPDSASELESLVESLEMSVEGLNILLKLAAQDAVGIDTCEHQVEETENGFKL